MNLYDFPPFRPPNEAWSALIRVTRGCPWNRCTFCGMYKNIRFKAKPFREIEEDVLKAREIYGAASSIFLGDSDNLVHKELPQVLAFIRNTFPEARRVTSYVRAKTVLKRPMRFLKEVRQAGLDRVHIGLESGDEVVLARLCKGASPEEMALAGEKAREAGFEVSFYVLSGAGGQDRWREHAECSARVLNRAQPDFIRLRTLTVQAGTPLHDMMAQGGFKITPPLKRLQEVELFIKTLDVKGCYLASDHVTNYLWADGRVVYKGVAGELPSEKDRMLATVGKTIGVLRKSGLKIWDSNDLYQKGHITTL